MADIAVAPPARTFFGEPRALGYLAFTEVWERFSYYGMSGILVLYLSQSLLLPGHVGHVAAFAPFRHALETVFGPMSTLALASQIKGLYTGFVYLTPILGGLIADRWIGRRMAVLLGAALMSAGQIAMAFDGSFLAALALLIVGCGFLKGNISTQVGALYAEDDPVGRARGFSIFSMGINVGAVAGPLAVGAVQALWGWHAAFALGGALMVVGLVTYLAGYRQLTEAAVRARARETPRREGEAKIVAALVAVMAISIFQSIAFYQNSTMALIWISANVDLNFFGRHMPVAWFNSIDSFVSIVSVPMLFVLWNWQSGRGGAPSELVKIATGALITCAANLLLVVGSAFGNHASAAFPVLYEVLLGIGFLYYWPTLLALVSRVAPPHLKATLMGCVFVTLFFANTIIGQLGTLYEKMPPASFWALHAGIAATGAVLALVLRRPLGNLLKAP